MNELSLKKANEWVNNAAIDPQDRQEIQTLLAGLPGTGGELHDRFYRGLEFGTGGMRGVLGMGENRLNKYTVRRAAQALAATMKKHFPQGSQAVVSYDSRHFSRIFAEETCAVMAANGITAHIFPTLTPTPMLSFAIRHLKAHAGVMVTASHNPPKYNGYKVFWSDGAQVVPPMDMEIVTTFGELAIKDVKTITFADGQRAGLIKDVPSSVSEAFYRVIEDKVMLLPQQNRQHGEKLKVVFTPLHGTGLVPCETIARRLGFTSFKTLATQAAPDGDFPTVKYPNPEDSAAMKLAVEEMLATGADLAFGTDPDGDRLGVVVNHKGEAHYPNGNQLGALFLNHVLKERKAQGRMPAKPLIVKSIVTSPVQEAIAKRFGAEVHATLTGFKWMAGHIRTLEEKKSGYNFVFASEESFGYMPHAESRDKDGVSSLALMCEIALTAKLKGRTLVDELDAIADEYGFFHEFLLSYDFEGVEGAVKIKSIMDRFRARGAVEFGGFKGTKLEDYLLGIGDLPKNNVLALIFANGDRIYLRPSGTEPKIKFYIMVAIIEGDLATKKKLAQERTAHYAELIKHWVAEA